jgi:hypothetical protein
MSSSIVASRKDWPRISAILFCIRGGWLLIRLCLFTESGLSGCSRRKLYRQRPIEYILNRRTFAFLNGGRKFVRLFSSNLVWSNWACRVLH